MVAIDDDILGLSNFHFFRMNHQTPVYVHIGHIIGV